MAGRRWTLVITLLCTIPIAAQLPVAPAPKTIETVDADGKPVTIDMEALDKKIDEAVAEAMADFPLTACQILMDFRSTLRLIMPADFNPPALEALGWACFGAQYQARGRYAESLDAFNRALELHVWLRNHEGIAATYHNIGATYRAMANYEEALRYHRLALTYCDLYGLDDMVAGTMNGLGSVQLQMGDYAAAIASFDESIDRIDPKDGKALVVPLTNLAVAYDDTGDRDRAIELYKQVIPLAEKEYDLSSAATAHNNLGTIYRDRDEYAPAYEHFDKAIQLAKRMRDRVGESKFRLNLAILHFRNLEIDDAARMVQAAKALASGGTTPEVSALLEEMDGLLLLEKNDFIGALAALHRSRRTYETLGAPAHLVQVWKAIAGASTAIGRRDDAIDAIRNSIRFSEEMRQNGRTPELRAVLFENNADAYSALAALLLAKGDRAAAFAATERARARVILDEMAGYSVSLREAESGRHAEKRRVLLAEIRELEEKARTAADEAALRVALDRKRAEYGTLVRMARASIAAAQPVAMAEPLTSAQVQAALPADTTLVSYWRADEKLTAFVLTRGSFHTVGLDKADEPSISKQTQSLRDFALLDDTVPTPLVRLYDALIRPIEPYLKTNRVVVVPCDVLHYIPFAALFDGSRYFGDRYVVSSIPSASVLAPPRSDRPRGTGVLAVAVNQPDGAGRTLPFAVAAAREVAAIFSAEPLLDERANIKEIEKRLPEAAYVLFAAHTELNEAFPLFSRFRLAAADGDPGFLDLHRVREMRLRADLVVLSGCSTQIGVVSEGEEVAALNRAFLAAGARAVVATLWNVKDDASAQLVTALYRHVKNGVPVDVALQSAQDEVRKRSAHPYYWAAFVVTGDGQLGH